MRRSLPGGRWWFRTTDLRLVRAIQEDTLTSGATRIIQVELLFCISTLRDDSRRISTSRGISAESQNGEDRLGQRLVSL
jgi:hypothetical protein